MKASFDEEFSRLSDECRRHIRFGKIDLYSSGLKEMAKLLEQEGRFKDEMRVLIPAFYIDLSGFGKAPYIDSSLPDMLWTVVSNTGIKRQELVELYLELIHPNLMPQHIMSVKDSLYIFQLCIDKKVEQAEYVLAQI